MLMNSPGAHPLSTWLGSTTTFGPWNFTIADDGLVLLHNDETPEYTRCLAAHGYERVSATPVDEDQDENSEVHSDYDLDAGEEPSMTALEQGMLCRITAVPERELSSGIVAGDTVRILSIDGGAYQIQRDMADKADTIAYCSAGLLVPLDKTASNPAAGPRPRVGQSVRIVGGEHRLGETGTLIEDDGSGVPFEVKFSDSETSWFVTANVAPAGPAGGGAVTTANGVGSKWQCVDPAGVAYRNSPSMEDRDTGNLGPSHGSSVTVIDRVGVDGNWLQVVYGSGSKYLPMLKDGLVLFASEDDVKVPQHQHVLKFHRCVSSGYTCDVCRRHFSNGDITYDCRNCDFDACLACASKYFPQPVKGKTPTFTAGSMTALEQGMLCRITAVPERELSSGIVAGDTVRILSIDGGAYQIQRDMADKADTIAYCSAGLLVPLDKTASNPAAGSRPRVGQSVRIVSGVHRLGETGTLIEDDGSGVPFKVKFSDSETRWFVAEKVALAGEPSTTTALEQGMLCRITAVPERELSSGIVAGDTVRILSIDGGAYQIQRDMADKADTIAYCSAGLLVPLDKTASNPAAGPRPRVGQSVRIVGGEHRLGETGTLIEDDGSPNMPFKVKFPDSDQYWFYAENVALAGPPENVEGELRQRPSRRSSFGAGEDESVDSDYDNDEDAFADLGLELLSGSLKLAKVYGQEEPPTAKDELEWETRYVVLYDTRKMCLYDGMQNGEPVGDRGLIDLETIQSVEKVLGVPTFVMKGYKKVYLFKLEPHDEVLMHTWIGAISVELSASPASEVSEPAPQPDRGAAFRPSLRSVSLRSLLGGGQKATLPPKAALLGAPATASMVSVLAQAKLMLRQGSTSVSSLFGGGEKLLPTGVPTSLSLCGELDHKTECLGTYLLAPQRTAHGKPVWKHAMEDKWIAWASTGIWKVQEGVAVGVEDAGFMKLEDTTASLPHQSTAVWEEYDGKEWQKAPSCKCFGDVPTSLSLCGELERMASCLGTYLLEPQLTAHGKPVWKLATGDRWIAWASDGKWMVQYCEEDVGVNNKAFMQLQETRASLPHQSTAVWEDIAWTQGQTRREREQETPWLHSTTKHKHPRTH